MSERLSKRYLFCQRLRPDLNLQRLRLVLGELLGVSTEEFEHKAAGIAKLNLVQQGAELAYLLLHDPLLHDPQVRGTVRKQHLWGVGRPIRLKPNIELLYKVLDKGIDGYHFDFFVLSAAPVEVIQSALEGIVPHDHIFGSEFRYTPCGEIDFRPRPVMARLQCWTVCRLRRK